MSVPSDSGEASARRRRRRIPSRAREESVPRGGEESRAVLVLAAFLVALLGYLCLVGWIGDWLRMSAAQLPIDVVSAFSFVRVLGDGLRATALTAVALTLLFAAAYLIVSRSWEVNGPEWHDIVNVGVRRARTPAARERRARAQRSLRRKRAERYAPVKAGLLRLTRRGASAPAAASAPAEHAPAAESGPAAEPGVADESGRARKAAAQEPAAQPQHGYAAIGEAGVRIVAGFNLATLSGVAAAGAAVLADEYIPQVSWWGVLLCAAAAFLAVYLGLARWGPLGPRAGLHGVVWMVLAALALFASAPLGVLALTSIAIATIGRAVARIARPGSLLEWAQSPLPWLLLAVVAVGGWVYDGTAPVSLPGAVLTTTSGSEQSGGYLSRSSSGAYIATCTQRPDATSTNARVTYVPASAIRALAIGGRAQVLDPGKRSSLLALAQHALGLDATAPTIIPVDLRPRRVTCIGGTAPATSNGAEGSLGAGVIEGGPSSAAQAKDGEPPIGKERLTPAPIGQLARLYQPTLLVASADRNWPVSVGAVLEEEGPGGSQTCLQQKRSPKRVCRPSAADLRAEGSLQTDYLQYPQHLRLDPSPNLQFEDFERGVHIEPRPIEGWVGAPRALDPWSSAQVYFYYAGVLTPASWPERTRDGRLPSKLETLEYWFFYPYNYYPLFVRAPLMQEAPWAAERQDSDFHQGDWEHVDVLLDPVTHAPLWVYMARHSDEGRFYPWGSAPLAFEGTHPIVQAAYGGHPSYPPGCGPRPRAKTGYTLNDWLVCGSQFSLRARNTPLVDLATTPWACWLGHFGEASTERELTNSTLPESVLDKLTHEVWVAGPPSPLTQAENSGVCADGPRAAEQSAGAER